MGAQRLPRTPREQAQWARRLVTGLRLPPIALFRHERESLGQCYGRIFCQAYEIGARAAVRELIRELGRSDDPLAGLPPHLVKSAQAAARGRRRSKIDPWLEEEPRVLVGSEAEATKAAAAGANPTEEGSPHAKDTDEGRWQA